MDKIKKVFSPGSQNDDEVMYGAPSKEPASASQASPSDTLETKPEAEQQTSGIARQIFNPGGNKYSEQSYGTTATAKDGMADQLEKEPTSREPLKGGETAQFNNDKVVQLGSDSSATGSAPMGTSSISPATGTTRDGPSTMAREDNRDDVSGATFTARSYALGSGQSATSSNVDQATRATTDLGPTGDEPSREHSGRRFDHSLAGAGTGGAGAGYVGADELNEFMKHGRDPEADQATYAAREHYLGSSSEADPFARPGHELYNAERGPAGVGSAGEMAPGHVPGEFPTDDGGDPHNSSLGIGTGSDAATGLGVGAGTGAAGIAASKAYNDRSTADPKRQGAGYSTEPPSSPIQTTTNTMRSGSFSKPSQTATSSPQQPEEKKESGGFRGALAAATAAMGLGGAGAYAASRDDKDDVSTKPAGTAAATAPSSQATRSVEPSTVAPVSATSEPTQSYPSQIPGADSSKTTSTPATTTQIPQPESEDHTTRNAGLGAGGLGAAGAGAYALSRDQDKNEPQSVVSDTTQKYSGSHPSDNDSSLVGQPSTTGSEPSHPIGQEDHTARNAALGAGGLAGAGAGAYALSNEQSNTPSNSSSGNVESSVSEATQRYHRSRPGDNDSNLRSNASPSTSSQHPSTSEYTPTAPQSQQPREEDHIARNAALGAAGVGAAGAGAYGLSNAGDNNTAGTGSSVVSPETQKYTGTHPSDTSAAYQGQSTVPSQQPREEDHTARNAALGAGGVGAAGAGAYGLSNMGRDDPSNSQSVVSPETQKYNGSRPSDSNSSYQTRPTTQSQQPREEDHTARNAALGAGAVGAAGAGAYGLSHAGDNTGNAESVVSPETQMYARSHPSDANPSLQSSTTTAPSSQTQPSSYAQQPREEDHTARNAALGAGTVGAAGAGGYALSRDDDKPNYGQSVVSPDTQKYTKTHPSDSNAAYQSTTTTTTTTTSQPTSQTLPSRSTGPIASNEPIANYDRSGTQPQQEDHTLRNAALGTTGVGAAGAGAYALGRDDDKTGYNQSTMSPQTSRPPERLDNSAMESSILGAGSSSSARPQTEDHTARNAALGAGGVSAAGAGAYAMGRSGDETGPASKTIGPHESNIANVMDPRVKPEPTQQFTKTTKGPHHSNFANRVDPKVTSGPAGTETREPQSHNYGRDAAIVGGAGATGAAGYGAYEYANREDPSGPYAQPSQVHHQSPEEKYREPRHEKHDPRVQHQSREEKYKEPKHETHDPRVQHQSREEKYKEPKHETHDPRVAAGSDGHNKLHKKAVDQEEDHTGRNAALGGAGVAGAGAAGYGAKEYYDDKRDSQATTDSQEKKHGFMHKILHPREHKREKEEEEHRRSSDNRRSYEQPSPPSHAGHDSSNVVTGVSGSDLKYGGEPRGPHGELPGQSMEGGDGRVTEPHTGLPMNVEKYGSVGAGGTDGAPQIEGYHQHGSDSQRM